MFESKKERALELATRIAALDPFALAIIEDELELLEEFQRDPTARLN
jgi:hypothetical protein